MIFKSCFTFIYKAWVFLLFCHISFLYPWIQTSLLIPNARRMGTSRWLREKWLQVFLYWMLWLLNNTNLDLSIRSGWGRRDILKRYISGDRWVFKRNRRRKSKILEEYIWVTGMWCWEVWWGTLGIAMVEESENREWI